MKALLLSILIIGLLLFSACGTLTSERQEIITFTRQALEIEAKRNELNSYIGLNGGYDAGFGKVGSIFYVNQTFLSGFSQETTLVIGPHPELEGMTSLSKRVLFLDCPQSMQTIKDVLNDVYSSEVELAELQLQGEGYYVGVFASGVPFFGTRLVLPEVNQHNIEFWLERYKSWQFGASSSTLLMNHPWVKLQQLRRDVYTRWTEILREHGIDPAEEGLTSLIKYLKE